MTDTELNAKLAQLLTVVEAGFASVNAEINGLKAEVAGLKAELAEVKADVAGLKTDVAGLKTEMIEVKVELATLNKRVLAVETQQAIMNARLEDQWRIITALIPVHIAAVGAASKPAAA